MYIWVRYFFCFLEFPRVREKIKVIGLPIRKHFSIFLFVDMGRKANFHSGSMGYMFILLYWSWADTNMRELLWWWHLRSAKSCADRSSITQQIASWAPNSWVASSVACNIGSRFNEDLNNSRNFQAFGLSPRSETKVPLIFNLSPS